MTDSILHAVATAMGCSAESLAAAMQGYSFKTNNPSTPLEWDHYYLNMARDASLKSKDPSTKTGAVIVRPDKSFCSLGFNGFPRRMPDKPEWYADRDQKYSRIIHCEMNALMFARERVEGYTLYTYPFMSCDRCFVHMVQAGITRFVAPKATHDQLTRWGAAFDKVRGYANDMRIVIEEVEWNS